MTLVTDVWITQKWSNPFLTWNPEKYGGIKTLHAQPKDVWVPDTALVNNAESDFAGSRTKYKTMVVLRSNGENIWMSPATFISSCRFDVSTFPFDTQLCDMTFGSWTFTMNKMILLPMVKSNLFSDSSYESGDWTIPSIKLDQHTQNLEYGDEKFARITYRLKLERKPIYFIMYLIVPSVLISLLVLFSFKIPVDSGERIGLCTTALLSMSVFLLLIGEHLPESSENIPLLAIASVLMMIEITLGFLGTIIVLKCHHNTSKPPNFLKCLCCIKSSTKAEPMVDPADLDPEAKQPTVTALLQAQISMIEKKEDKYQQEWKIISKTMDRIFFYLFLAFLIVTLAGVYLFAPLIVKLERDL
ncbi:neuronal acetylcholine receptor subunit beta-3-like isoform X2 [Dendronephthya gigantea]|nr:neuronal acetylcholine receptor subunit beta-3-like isoform X2 [Dendronephthya gigantea]